MHIELEGMKTKVPVFRGRDAENNKLILEVIAFQGPLIKYDVFRSLKSRGVRYYPTISRRIDDLKKRGYLAVAGKRTISVGRRKEKSPTYALTWRGFIASLMIAPVIKDVPRVLECNPLLKFNLPFQAPKEMITNVIKELFSLKEIETIARVLLVGFLRALPRNIELIEQEKYLAYLVPGIIETPEIREKFEGKDLRRLLQIPGLLGWILDLVTTYEGQLLEAVKDIQILKQGLSKYVDSQKQIV